MSDTICAICTSLGVGAISIIRISGEDSFNIVSKIFTKNLNKLSDHSINYGYIKYNDELIDEVLVSIMKAPNTYTKEDVVEINCHGGISSTNKILEILLENGCRLATPGEFTKRAFLNGRIDISQAQAVNDLLYSKTNSARKVFMNGLTGLLNKKIESIRKEILNLISNIEVNIDFPEYEDNLVITKDILKSKISKLDEEFEKLIKDAKTTKLMKNGINVSLVGLPNAGKSSVLNALLNEEKAIVSDIKGTTRDVVEGTIELNGILINLFDTAGIRKTTNKIEQIGVSKSLKLIDESDLVILIIDTSKKITNEEKDIINNTPKSKLLIFGNKDDILKNKLDISDVIYGNTTSIEGIRPLKDAIINKFNLGEIETNDITYLSNVEQVSIIKKCSTNCKHILKMLKNDEYVDMIEIDLKEILDLLGNITGSSYDEELLDTLFKNFCLGK
jgi:tRNA modification GTPase